MSEGHSLRTEESGRSKRQSQRYLEANMRIHGSRWAVHIYIFIYAYTRIHTHTHTRKLFHPAYLFFIIFSPSIH